MNDQNPENTPRFDMYPVLSRWSFWAALAFMIAMLALVIYLSVTRGGLA